MLCLRRGRRDLADHRVGLVVLMEADPIREPAQLENGMRGLRVVGPAWTDALQRRTRAPGPLTDLGRELLRRAGFAWC